MSTVDPAVSRRTKVHERAGRPGFLVAAIGGAVIMAACAVMLGLAIGSSADMFRHMMIDSMFDDREVMPTFWGMGTIGFLWMLGTGGVVVSGLVTGSLIDAYRGGERSPLLLPPLGVCAAAVGIVFDAPTWLEPLEVGTEVDPAFHDDKTWSVFAWIAHYADVWFPVLAVVVAALVVFGSIRHNQRLRRQIAERTRLLSDGRRVRGTITDVTLRTSTNDQGQRSVVGADVVVRYVDDHEVERWVTRRTRDRSMMPGTGQVEVLFDPLQPDRDDLVFVSFHRDPYPAEWVGAAV